MRSRVWDENCLLAAGVMAAVGMYIRLSVQEPRNTAVKETMPKQRFRFST
jgi:hypothetical protein